MKTMPKVGDRVWVWSIAESNTKIKGTVIDVNYGFVEGVIRFCLDSPRAGNCLFHYSQINRLVKKPRKCEECAKPKQLFYVGHDGDIVTQTQIERRLRKHKTDILTMWEYISTLALISTEEVKK